MTVMVFKAPGPEKIHGHMVEFVVVDESGVDDKLGAGWHLTAIAAGEAFLAEQQAAAEEQRAAVEQAAAKELEDDTRPPTRDELEQMATKLGIAFSARVSDRKLRKMIEAATSPDAESAAPAPVTEPAAAYPEATPAADTSA